MAKKKDRSICITFSVRLSALNKLERLITATGKNRSELLASWIDRDSDPEPSKPAELAKEPT